jgi:hypothetical protein
MRPQHTEVFGSRKIVAWMLGDVCDSEVMDENLQNSNVHMGSFETTGDLWDVVAGLS